MVAKKSELAKRRMTGEEETVLKGYTSLIDRELHARYIDEPLRIKLTDLGLPSGRVLACLEKEYAEAGWSLEWKEIDGGVLFIK